VGKYKQSIIVYSEANY